MTSSEKCNELFEQVIRSRLYHTGHSSKHAGKATGFIERSILGVIGLLKEAVSNDEIASRKGFLQARDPRFKCISIVLLLASVCITKSNFVLFGYYALCLLMALFSSIGPVFFLKRTLFFIPLFSFFIALPAIFSFVTPGHPLASFTIFSTHFSITRQGVDSALIFFFRVLASVSIVILLLLTTRQHVLLKVLRIFKVPQVFVMTMGMCYRYIFLLLDIIQKTFIAMKSRVGFVTSAKTGRRIVGATTAGLWLRSYQLHSQVYSAMLSRGYTGEPQVLIEFRAKATDAVFLGVSFFALIGTVWMNRFIH
jgi:cobalt/nickel transport system permease protein